MVRCFKGRVRVRVRVGVLVVGYRFFLVFFFDTTRHEIRYSDGSPDHTKVEMMQAKAGFGLLRDDAS